MASFVILNSTRLGSDLFEAGAIVDAAREPLIVQRLQAAMAMLVPTTAGTILAVAEEARIRRRRGASLEEIDAFMIANGLLYLAPAGSLSNNPPQPIGTTAPGVGGLGSRDDHVHAHGNQGGGALHAIATSLSPGFLSAGDKALIDSLTTGAQLFRWDTVIDTCVGNGQKGFLIARGAWVRAIASDLIAELSTDGGATWTPLVFGVDWTFCVRQYGQWPQPSTADAVAGVQLAVGRIAGDQVRLTWKTGRILCPPPEPRTVYLVGGAIVQTEGLRRYVGGTPPNGFAFGNRIGLQIEGWRRSVKSPRTHVTGIPNYSIQFTGHHWTPFIRLPVATNGDDAIFDPFTGGWGFGMYPSVSSWRFCYYDPATGARSELSAAQGRVVRRGAGDRVWNVGTGHPSGTVWVRS